MMMREKGMMMMREKRDYDGNDERKGIMMMRERRDYDDEKEKRL